MIKQHHALRTQLIAAVTGILIAASLPSAAATPGSSSKDAGAQSQAGPDAAAQFKAPIKLGLILSITGVSNKQTREVQRGIQLYLDQVGYKMGGRKLDVLTENDGGKAEVAEKLLKKFVETDHVDVVGGLLSGWISHSVIPLADQYKIPVVESAGGDDDLTQRNDVKWLVRISWANSQTALPFGAWVYHKLGYKKIAIIAMDYQYGWQNSGGFQRTFEAAGGKVIQKLWAPLGLSDYSALIKQLSKDADAVYMVSAFDAVNTMTRQYREFGPHVPLIGNGSTTDEPTLTHGGDAVLGMVTSFNYSAALNNPGNRRFVAAYRAKYNEDPGHYSESGYTSMMWLDKAIQMLHGDVSDHAKLMAALKKVELPDAPRGPIKLDAYGNVIQNVYVRQVRNVNGHLENTVIDKFPQVSQFYDLTPSEFLKHPVFSKTYPPCTYSKNAESLKDDSVGAGVGSSGQDATIHKQQP